MYSKLVDGIYADGTGDTGPCNDDVPFAPAAVDAQFWNLLADADDDASRKTASITFSLQQPGQGQRATVGLWEENVDYVGAGGSGEGKDTRVYGVRFSTWGNGVQWENTASAVMAMARYLAVYKDAAPKEQASEIRAKLELGRSSLVWLLSTYKCVPASILGGNISAFSCVNS